MKRLNKTLLSHESKGSLIPMAIFCAVLTMYSITICVMYDPKLGESLAIMMDSMPGIFSAFGMAEVSTTLLDFIINYLYGFLFIAFPMIYIILSSSRLVSKYIENGSMTYLLSAPVKRRVIISTQCVVLHLSSIGIIIYSVAVCILASSLMFPGELDIANFLIANLGLIAVMVFFCGACFMFSCIFSESKHSTGCSAALCIGSLLIQMLANVGDKISFLKYLTPLTLFNPSGLASHEPLAFVGSGILLAAGIVMSAIGIKIFSRRNLSI